MKKLLIAITAIVFTVSACSKASADYYDSTSSEKGDMSAISSEGSGQGYAQGQAGVVTAAEWNDLEHWPFWGRLMTSKEDEQTAGYGQNADYWQFWSDRRVVIRTSTSDGTPAAGVKVALFDGETKIWSAVTDALGQADCWIYPHAKESQAGTLSISLNGVKMSGSPTVTALNDLSISINKYTVDAAAPEMSADILFIVDATGSMSDELEFLKADLMDILEKAKQLQTPVSIRTGALFYRDEGDDYVTISSPFSTDFSQTTKYISKQHASGGADYPEAVHTALEKSLQDFDWNTNARARIAFMLLDAPPHHDQQGVVESVWQSIDKYAEMGIKMIPIASSGVDKPTEFLLRMMAIATNGTYVFITNDSGIGNDHIVPTVGNYQVELLNDLMVKLIQRYLE